MFNNVLTEKFAFSAVGLLDAASYILGQYDKISSPKLSVEQTIAMARAKAAMAQVHALLLIQNQLGDIANGLRAKQHKPKRKSKKT